MPILHWLNREEHLKIAGNAPYRLLEEVPELSYGDKDAGNMLVQGDNLEALKALLPFYAGQVKCIYIDPPYNTGSAFEHYDDNLEHSKWLEMMYPRLKLLREFLREDGTIWISIDDDESHYLKVICDEVFGRKNFVSNVIWEKKYSPQNDTKWLSDSHDHILIFANAKNVWRPNPLPRSVEMNNRYKNPDNDPRGVWKSADFSVRTYNASCDYPITLPSGRIVRPPESRAWITSEERFKELIKDNRIWFGQTGNNVPSVKKFLTEVRDGSVSKTIWFRSEVGDNQEAKKETKILSDRDVVFTTPKPERLIERVLTLGSNEGDLVLDSFLGSGTTAAVAHKMGRKYIGIEMGEHAKTHCALRLKKVIEGEQGGISKAQNWQGGGGFRFFKLGEEVFDECGCVKPDINFGQLAAHIWFSETYTPIKKVSGKSTFLGVHDNTAYALLYNGILHDRKVNGGNVLTSKTLEIIKSDIGLEPYEKLVIYGECSRMSAGKLKALKIEFKQTPYDVKAR